MSAQVFVAHPVMTGNALALGRAEKIWLMSNERHGSGFAGTFKICMALQASRVEDIVFAVRTFRLPVDGVEIVGQLRPRIMHAESSLHEHVVDGVVVWNVALSALGLHAAVAGATVDILPIAVDHRRHRMAAAAKRFARRPLHHRFRNDP